MELESVNGKTFNDLENEFGALQLILSSSKECLVRADEYLENVNKNKKKTLTTQHDVHGILFASDEQLIAHADAIRNKAFEDIVKNERAINKVIDKLKSTVADICKCKRGA